MSKIEECKINVNVWLLVMYHTSIYLCKVIKIGDFEGLFIRKKPTLKKNPSLTHFIYPDIPDELNFLHSQMLGKLEPPKILRRGIHQFIEHF